MSLFPHPPHFHFIFLLARNLGVKGCGVPHQPRAASFQTLPSKREVNALFCLSLQSLPEKLLWDAQLCICLFSLTLVDVDGFFQQVVVLDSEFSG